MIDDNNLDSQLPYSGLVCYRVNDALEDNEKSNFNKNYIYVFRPSETGINDAKGDINKALLSLNYDNGNRSEIGNSDENATIKDNALVYTNDINSQIQVKLTNQGTDYVTFDIVIPEFSKDTTWESLIDNNTKDYFFGDNSDAKNILKLDDSLYFLNGNKVYSCKDGVYSVLGSKVANEVNNAKLLLLNNELYVFYADYSSSNAGVVLKKYENGEWIEKGRIKTGYSYANAINAVVLNNEIYAVYDLDNKNVKVVKWNGNSFADVGNLDDIEYLMAPSMAIYKDDLYVICSDFMKSEGGNIYKLTDGKFNKVYTINNSANHFQKLVVDNNNIYAFTYNTSTNKTIIAKSEDGINWDSTSISSFEEDLRDISFDVKNGNIYLGVVNNNKVAKVMQYDNGEWVRLGNNIYTNADKMAFVLDDKLYAYVSDDVKYKTLVKFRDYSSDLVDDSDDGVMGPDEEKPPVDEEKPPIEDDNEDEDNTQDEVEKPQIVLSKVTAKGVSYSYNSIKLTWNSVKNANGYYIYRYDSNTKTYKLIKTLTGSATSYINSSLTLNKYYSYKVVAFNDTQDLVKSESNVVKVKSILKTTNVSLVAGKKKATIKWSKVSGASGYQIYTKNSKGKYVLMKTTSKTSYVKTKLTPKKTYYYKVRSYRTVSGKKVYSSFSSIKKVKVK